MLVDVHALAASLDDLLAGVEDRRPFANLDGRSTAAFEHVRIAGVVHVVKYVHLDDDFTMRVSGDLQSRTVRAWQAGLLDCAPELIDHAIVGAATGLGRNGWGAALLMRDVSADLLPLGNETIPAHQHAAFLDRLAGFCAASWGWRDDPVSGPGLLPYAARWAWFGHSAIEGERALGWPERVPRLAEEGWRRFGEVAPADVVRLVEELRRDVTPLAEALRRTPSCFLHGDVKASNTGFASDGRTVLIDWAYVGEGPACHELAWHLALDRSRLPGSKEATAEAFRAGLERHGVDTGGWWDRQLSLCLLGAVVQMGWEKALGDGDELAWWCHAAREGATWL
jgi:Phosphotransferase enzyme family